MRRYDSHLTVKAQAFWPRALVEMREIEEGKGPTRVLIRPGEEDVDLGIAPSGARKMLKALAAGEGKPEIPLAVGRFV